MRMGLYSLNFRCKSSLLALVPAILFFLLPHLAGAGVSGSAVTSLDGWDESGGAFNSSVSQYFRLNTQGQWHGLDFNIEGSGRVTDIKDEVAPGDSQLNRLYSLALTIARKDGSASMVLGRQMVSAPTNIYLIDGLSLNLDSGDFTFNTRLGAMSDVENLDPDNEITFGLGMDYRIISGMVLALDYARTFEGGALRTEQVAIDWDYSWFRYTRAYFNINYDLMSHALYETAVGTRLYFPDLITLGIEYSQNQPLFESDSIYSAFAVDEAEAFSFSILFTPSPKVRYIWKLSDEFYKSGSGKRYTIGGRWSPGRSRISTEYTQYGGSEGDLKELGFDYSAAVLPGFDLGLGGNASRTSNPGEDAVAGHNAYIGCRWSPASGPNVDVRLEQTGDDIMDKPVWSGHLSFSFGI
ncbi:MAG TPA: hypothetical protein ENH32_00485 [Proteobacteria bacterium]|nr:hypothetical protein BMS3Abin14_00920 [bacterium BMS3Abin14]HDL52436.1 hypothetical protein [Pseudomonadota bacterium]